tara:strand:- start:2434 stop:4494 length:2061 start_codon:yes stop_codon:yes gene_type:complete
MKKTYIYDYETIKNCFLAVYINNKNTKDIVKFEVSDFENQFEDYIKFQKHLIKSKNYIVSFNGLNFDSQVAVYCLSEYRNLKNLTGGEIAREIFLFVQKLLDLKNEKGWSIYKIADLPFNEIDLAAINNYNNQAKFASLKWLQYNMDWDNIMDMNCKPDDILNQKEIIQLTIYCINDCLSTRALLALNVDQIIVRQELSKHFGIELQNLSEPKLAKAILMDLLSKDLNIDPYELKNKQTYRKVIHLDEAILPYIKFITPPLKKTLNMFKKLKLDGENLKGAFKHSVTYRGLEFSFALGGIHGAKRGYYKEENNMIVKSFDVKSYYPNLCIRNNWSPAHLDATTYCKRYEWFYDERLKYPKSNPLNYLYKIILNAAYGLSNDKHSPLKDSFLTMQTTVNGQLLLVQLMEEICETIPGARPVMVNTDGGEIIFPKEYEHLYDKICKEWEDQTDLILEYEYYDKLIIWDVNNYIGIFKSYEISYKKAQKLFKKEYPKPLIKLVDGKYYHHPVKCKGRFEVNKALHKNKSYRIKAIAVYNYFVHGVDPEKTLKNHRNIYDFCAGVRAKGAWKIKQTCIKNGDIYDEDTQKTVRYYVSHKGCKLVKKLTQVVEEDHSIYNNKGEVTKSYLKGDIIKKQSKVEAANVLEQVAITIDPKKKFEDYDINYDFYMRLIRKEIQTVEPTNVQQNLF